MKSIAPLFIAGVITLAVACAPSPPRSSVGASAGSSPSSTGAPPPSAPKDRGAVVEKESVRDVYHGTEVEDPYRWLEDTSSERVKAFTKAQNERARTFLDAVPQRGAVSGRLKQILSAKFAAYRRPAEVAGTLFALKLQPPRQQAILVTMAGVDGVDAERILLDPDALDASGHTSIDWFRPSPDGKYVAVSLSKGGSEAGDVHVFATADGKEAFEVVPRVHGATAGGDLEWQRDSKGFFYTHYPRGNERSAADSSFYVQVYRHVLGTPSEKDVYELGKDFPRIAGTRLDADASGHLLASVQNGDNGEFMHFLRHRDGQWKRLTRFEDRIVQIVFGEKKELYLTSFRDAPHGKLLRAPIAGFDLAQARVIVPEGKDTLMYDFHGYAPLLAHGKLLYVTYQLGGPSEIRIFDLEGKPRPAPKQLPVSSVSQLTPLHDGEVLFANASFIEPTSWIHFNPSRGEARKTKLSTRSPVDLSNVQVVRELATSKDGTQVPLNVLLPDGHAAGDQIPFELTGYGGFGRSVEPMFDPMGAILLERGVGIAIANLRGGAEFGADWHNQGRLTRKQNVFDDFLAAFEHLRTRRYARRDRIAIMGASNGALLAGAMLTQTPQLPRVVVAFAGLYDMLRFEAEPNGAFNATEYGTVKDPEQFKALYAYSPYHRVNEKTPYPPVLFLTGENDSRVAPWHSHKMVARLQNATSSESPILERVQASAGHGIGNALDTVVEQYTDAYAFLLHHLGVAPDGKISAQVAAPVDRGRDGD